MMSGEQLRLVGMDTALANIPVGDTDHVERITAALLHLTGAGTPFSADHIRSMVPTDTQAWMDLHYNVLPSLVGHHARAGRIRQVDWCTPSRRTRHGNPNRIWIGAHA